MNSVTVTPESGQKLWLVKKVILHSFIYCLWIRDKKHKVKKVKCKCNESTAKELIFLEYNNILQKKKHLSFAQNFAIIDQGKQDYKVNYVNTDLHHQYGIFAFFKVQTCLPRNVPIGEEREEMAANISVQRKYCPIARGYWIFLSG